MTKMCLGVHFKMDVHACVHLNMRAPRAGNVCLSASYPIFLQFVMCFYVQNDKISLQTPTSLPNLITILPLFPAMEEEFRISKQIENFDILLVFNSNISLFIIIF